MRIKNWELTVAFFEYLCYKGYNIGIYVGCYF